MNTAEQFLVNCRMTCLGGSEKGTCECRGPINCTLQKHPKYDEYRMKAVTRMAQHLSNVIGADLVFSVLDGDPYDVG